MFVCLCNGITESQIRAAASTGISTLEELTEHLGVASQCGQCGAMAQAVLEEGGGMAIPEDRFYAAVRPA
ncbi:bacterioferritin-associated ferredoxin [Pseudohaliea rubra]|uniref:Bacterioferritin-associated ferredoxin n=1 Tax=Pseudohaliea rubra DSM 19751 TaxID=1265313 RepID=A0A095WV63_9GAMM|nr:bacterioferritin-associated ferredoxin [Pseudohaliea rubra]KGE02554.1 Bacterioferritin-associated ferredoxin [Pseudohaliea rubra DSM 19751]